MANDDAEAAFVLLAVCAGLVALGFCWALWYPQECVPPQAHAIGEPAPVCNVFQRQSALGIPVSLASFSAGIPLWTIFFGIVGKAGEALVSSLKSS